LAPVMVFLISSPLISPSAFMVTMGGLGVGIALWKLASAVAMGLAAGVLTNALTSRGYLDAASMRVATRETGAPKCTLVCEGGIRAETPSHAWLGKKRVMNLLRNLRRYSIFIGKFIIIAIIAQAVIVRFMPQHWVSAVVGGKNAYAVLIAPAIGVPAYINSISAVPLLAGLMDLGMDKGAVLAFIIAGPVMSVPSILAVMALFRWKALYIYVAIGFFGALAFGYAYDIVSL
jgi:uncharacterized membrane protein YraQ (UPF0718 family)